MANALPAATPVRDWLTVRCSLYFGLFSIFVSGLLGLGQESWSLPLLVSVSVALGLVYTDWLAWFSLNRFFVYVLMIAGAFVAIMQYLTNPGSDRLMAVGNLLVFVQLPLVFQKKAKRVFEQWGVFLLLELVVAALVNDNVLYGVLMVPALVIGCAAMMALALYSSRMLHNDSRAESTNILSRSMRWLGMDPMLSKKNMNIKLSSLDDPSSSTRDITRAGGMRWRWLIVPITMSVFVFAAAFFYTLPRTQIGAYQTNSWGSPSVGFSEQVSLRSQGDIQQNELPAFRMVMVDEKTGQEFRPTAPPYIRMSVLHKYYDGPSQGIWQRGDSTIAVSPRTYRNVPVSSEIEPLLVEESDSVLVSITEKANFGASVACIPPYSRANTPQSYITTRRDWRMVDTAEESILKTTRRRYSFRTYGFKKGVEKSLLHEVADAIPIETSRFKVNDSMSLYSREEITEFPPSLTPIIAFRDSVLQQAANLSDNKYSHAKYLESYLATSPEFKYSLRNSAAIDNRADPIVDFLLNKKKGHCEYYASALAMLLRSMNIPTRLVSGYRPSEYNEIGRYFPVQQKHAHVWVEAYFTVDELKDTYLAEMIPSWVKTGMWARLDPTPSGDEATGLDSFKTPDGQAFGMLQELWSELVMNVDKSRQSNMLSLFGETSENSYKEYWEQLADFFESLKSSSLIGGLLSPDKWFSWRAAVFITLLSGVIVGIYKLLVWLFPGFVPRIKGRAKPRGRATRVEFYNRITKALGRLKMARKPWETPREFLAYASARLAEKGVAMDGNFLAACFYELRFGGATLEPEVEKSLNQLVAQLEALKS
ncbi:transglutaminase TgpA family protein [Pirellulaceae bacterium SH449]